MKNKMLLVRFSFILFCLIISLSLNGIIVKANVNDVVITNVYPNNQNANYNPRLSLNINDPQGAPLSVRFEINISGTWQTIGTKQGGNGLYTQQTNASGMDVKNTSYYWRVNISDGVNSIVRTYRFTAQPFVLKWTYVTNATTNIGPLAVDVNKDGFYEVFQTGLGKITCLDGRTGALLWSYSGAGMTEHSPFEIHDLNNDGIEEVVIAAGPRTIALHANDGSVYWNVPVESGDKHLVIVDTDGNGYPYVYTATTDIEHWTNGTGRIRKLRGTDGRVMAEVFSWRPCYGGLSADDVNNDGKFEIYMGDRSVTYQAPSLGKGIQAYDADNLSLLWYDDEVLVSSNSPALIDVNNDGVRDAISVNEEGWDAGIVVYDGAKSLEEGKAVRMPGKWASEISGLTGHSQFSVWDIDGDGNLELITNREDYVKVWDIGDWKLDATLDYAKDPPKIADVIGDSKLEIILAEGDVKIYNGSYSLIETIPGANAIAQTLVQDIDNDGQNELIVTSYLNGIIKVYDTSAYAPTPRVRTNALYYSERRLGVGVYIPPLGAPQPILKEESPSDNRENVDLKPTLSIYAIDFHYDLMNIEMSIYDETLDDWVTIGTWSNASNGVYNAAANIADKYDHSYIWRVRANDPYGDNLITTQEFTFTTKAPPPWQMPGWAFRKKVTVDRTKVVGSNTDFPVLIDITDSDLKDKLQSNGNDLLFTDIDGVTKLNHEIESYDLSTGHLVVWVKAPSVSATQDAVIYMYYGNAGAENQQNSTGVWDSNYLAVHHLEETSGTVEDSTINNNDGTPSGSMNQNVTGKIDGADQLDGVDDKIVLPQVLSGATPFTIEFWMNTSNKQGYAVSQWDADTGVFIQHYRNGSVQMYLNGNSVSRITTLNTWHHVVGTYDGSTARLYIDGASTAKVLSFTSIAQNMIIGDRYTGTRNFQGKLDEVRISKTSRSNDYIRTSFNNQNSPGTFIILGAEETSTSEPLILNPSPANKANGVPRNLTQISFELFDNQNDLMNYTLNTSPDIGSGSKIMAPNGNYAVNISGLQSGMTYNWTITLSAGSDTKVKSFEFTVTDNYDLITSTAGGGSMNVSSLPPYTAGASVNLTATPGPDKEFLGWTGDLGGSNNPATIIMDSDKNIRALFRDPGSLLVDSEFDYSINDSDIRANSTFQDWYESRNQVKTLLTMDNTNIGGNVGNKTKLIGDSTGNAYLTQEFSSPQTGTFSVQWDIYVDSIINITTTDYAGLMFVGDDINPGITGPNYGSGENFVWMAFFKDGGGTSGTMDLRATNRTGAFVTIAPELNLKQWYTIRVDCNLDTGTYDVYVNGELKASNVSSRTAKTALTHITFAQWNDGAGTFYVDNVKQYAPVVVCTDADLDNYSIEGGACGPVDCDDTVASCTNDCLTLAYQDADIDTFGNPAVSSRACDAPVGFVLNNIDCDDTNVAVNPGAIEVCGNLIDDNCNGATDEGCTPSTLADWKYRKSITVNRSKVAGNLIDFPVLVDITDADLISNALISGDDILFTTDDGTTKLNHEIESYNSTTGRLIAWINVPSLNNATDTVLYMYYGNIYATNQENTTEVWDADYVAVLHLAEKSGSIQDSTINNYTGIPNGSMNQDVSGKIDGADRFDGVDDKIILPQLSLSQNQFTFELWMNTANKQGYAVSQSDPNIGAFIQHYSNGSIKLFVNDQSITMKTTYNTWHHIVGVYDGTNAQLYVDGVSSAPKSATLTWPAQPLYLGDRSTGQRAFQGQLDEIRVSKTPRSQAYIRTSFSNQNNPASFIIAGAQENNPLFASGLMMSAAVVMEAPECVTNEDCLANNLLEIATCRNVPDVGEPDDSNPYTWDIRQTFTSGCIEGICTNGNETIIHTCDVIRCSAECDVLSPCVTGKTCMPDCTCA